MEGSRRASEHRSSTDRARRWPRRGARGLRVRRQRGVPRRRTHVAGHRPRLPSEGRPRCVQPAFDCRAIKYYQRKTEKRVPLCLALVVVAGGCRSGGEELFVCVWPFTRSFLLSVQTLPLLAYIGDLELWTSLGRKESEYTTVDTSDQSPKSL